MTKEEFGQFQQWISRMFEHGERRRRELRLSRAEVRALYETCPNATLEPMGPGGDKTWYRVTLPPLSC